jgi:cyclomaltodextrinase
MNDEVLYGVIPRNVGPLGFRSVTEKLDGWRELGVTALWLSPINATPEGNFGYAVTDYFRLRPELGTEDDFRELVQAAHERGLKVLMDFVPNHTSAEHPYFVDAQARGAESPYSDFYDRDEHAQPTHYFDWTDLPNLNFDNPDVEREITEAFCHWIREFDIDGYRVDVAWGIRQRKPDFWPRLRRTLEKLKPDVLLLAEASARDPYYFGHGFDAAYDWTDELGKWAWEHVFEDQGQIVPRLHAALTNEGRGYADDAVVLRFLNNNDTDTRFITRHGPELTKVATALLLTLPGVPCVYVGDEVGAEFQPYRDAGPISWEDRHGLRPLHQDLIRVRTTLPSLRAPGWQPLSADGSVDGSPHVYGYLRFGDEGRDPVLVLLNFSAEAADVRVTLPPGFESFAQRPVLTDRLTGEELPAGDAAVTVPLEPWAARILS